MQCKDVRGILRHIRPRRCTLLSLALWLQDLSLTPVHVDTHMCPHRRLYALHCSSTAESYTHVQSIWCLPPCPPPTPQLPLISAICLLMLGIWLLFHGNITSSMGMSQCVYVCVCMVSHIESSALNFAFKQKIWIQRVVVFNRLDRIPKGRFSIFNICLSQLQHLML